MTIFKLIKQELIHHAPFTALGAAGGIIIAMVIVFSRTPREFSNTLFYTLHPLHVVMSALATTAMYRLHGKGKLWMAILIGYSGSIGIATLSDAIIPYLGGSLLGISMEFHVPFLETTKMPVIGIATWQIVNGAAAIGIILGYLRPTTKFPHSSHVFLSTWASLFNFIAFGTTDWLGLVLLPLFLFLFLAVWLPCCISDIVYPLIWADRKPPVTLADRASEPP